MALSEYMKSRAALIEAGRPLKTKEKKPIAKVSEKRKAKLAEQKDAGTDTELDRFFVAMRKKMVGKCLFCGSKSCKDNDDTYRRSIAHLFPKRSIDKGGFPSIAVNENNWIELCWTCHTDFDNAMISWVMLKDSAEWFILKEKLLNLLPLIPPEERKNKLYSKLEKLVYGV